MTRADALVGGVRAVVALALLMTAGCASGPNAESAVRVGAAFEQLLASGDSPAACRMLTESAYDQLDGGCSSLDELPHVMGSPTTQVRGRMAMLHYADDTVFLSRSHGGWQVIAAGCHQPKPDRPYSCTVDGG